jgi:osmotically-inducible protein OsmY
LHFSTILLGIIDFKNYAFTLKYIVMKTDYQIQEAVIDELKWDPSLNASQIGVAVKDGIVTLSGKVDFYSQKTGAERAAKKVAGVKAVAEDIQVGNSAGNKKTDTEIAEAVLSALKWHTGVQEEKIKIKVEDGIITLEGEVEWELQRVSAKSAIENLAGVRSVTNLIRIKPAVKPVNVKQKINEAFHRSATIDAGKITIEMAGTKVILTGKVRSLAEKEDAAAAAWNAPGVTWVDNMLRVEAPEYSYEEE